MDIDHNGKITLQNYISSLEKCPNLLEVYEFMNNSFSSSSIFEAGARRFQDQENLKVIENVKNLEDEINALAKRIPPHCSRRGSSFRNSPKIMKNKQFKNYFGYDNCECEPEVSKGSTKTIKKIDDDFKKLLYRANIDSEEIAAPFENIKSRDLSERVVSEKIPFSEDVSNKNSKVFQFNCIKLQIHQINDKGIEKKRLSIEKKFKISYEDQSPEDLKYDENISFHIHKMQKQVKNIRENLEKQIAKANNKYFLF